ncbi:MAG: tRNA 2-selenouridine(34) synthase MnmH [Halioglobus sp.]
MSQRPDTENYRELLLHDAPMMDMRAPTEFERGAFPSAHSLPLMSDEERAEVGTCYKQEGQDAAIALGHKIVSGQTKAERLDQWQQFARTHPSGYLYCFRGGLRSQTVQQWLRDSGCDYPLIKGGYKAMRRFLIEELERILDSTDMVLIGGKTGSGKTRVIAALEASVDLEGLARHRGSTFGHILEPQPSQIDFENAVCIGLMKSLAAGSSNRLYLEDEGRLIGRVALPVIMQERMKLMPLAVVQESLASRVEVVLEDYVLDLGQRYAKRYGDEGPRLHCEKLQADLAQIKKRLGGEREQIVSALMDSAFSLQHAAGDLSVHREWIQVLLETYYDPMYDYQLSRRAEQIVFSGDRAEIIEWAQQNV